MRNIPLGYSGLTPSQQCIVLGGPGRPAPASQEPPPPIAEPPDAPVALPAEDVNVKSGDFTACWEPVVGATGYIYESSVYPDANFAARASLEGTAYPDTNPDLDNAFYYYRVYAVNDAGSSGPSNVVAVDFSVVPVPVALEASDLNFGTGEFVAHWEAVGGDYLYEIELSTSSEFSENAAITPVDAAVVFDTVVSPDYGWFYRVRAYDARGLRGDWSNVVYVPFQ